MKVIALTILGILITGSVSTAQQETLLRGGIESGVFGGPVVKFSEVGGEFAVFAGGRGGWIINHTLVLGGGGYGVASNLCKGEFPFEREVEFGYGGLELEYINRSDHLVHFSIYTLIGAGGVTYLFDRSDAVFVLEPAINLMLNVTTFFRIGVGAGYRIVTAADLDLSNSDLSAPFGVLTFKFGGF
jgi:hypothetical protein